MPVVLLVRMSSLGDIIHTLPAVSDLARAFPHVALDWVVEENFAGLPALHPAVRYVLPVALRRWRRQWWRALTWREWQDFRTNLQEQAYDVVVDAQGLLKSAGIAAMAHGLRTGFDADSARERLAAHFYHRPHRVLPGPHMVERHRRLLGLAFGYTPEGAPEYGLEPQPAPAWAGEGAYAVALTATSRDDKLWPEAQWQALFAARPEVLFWLPWGNAQERARAERLARPWAHVQVCPAPLLWPEAVGLLQHARWAVGVDTGLSHLAVACACPTVGLYLRTDPSRVGLYGAPYAHNLGGIGAQPTASQVLEVLAAWPG